jgi:hypothetical protein
VKGKESVRRLSTHGTHDNNTSSAGKPARSRTLDNSHNAREDASGNFKNKKNEKEGSADAAKATMTRRIRETHENSIANAKSTAGGKVKDSVNSSNAKAGARSG